MPYLKINQIFLTKKFLKRKENEDAESIGYLSWVPKPVTELGFQQGLSMWENLNK